jgi:hypothetical protein
LEALLAFYPLFFLGRFSLAFIGGRQLDAIHFQDALKAGFGVFSGRFNLAQLLITQQQDVRDLLGLTMHGRRKRLQFEKLLAGSAQQSLVGQGSLDGQIETCHGQQQDR